MRIYTEETKRVNKATMSKAARSLEPSRQVVLPCQSMSGGHDLKAPRMFQKTGGVALEIDLNSCGMNVGINWSCRKAEFKAHLNSNSPGWTKQSEHVARRGREWTSAA